MSLKVFQHGMAIYYQEPAALCDQVYSTETPRCLLLNPSYSLDHRGNGHSKRGKNNSGPNARGGTVARGLHSASRGRRRRRVRHIRDVLGGGHHDLGSRAGGVGGGNGSRESGHLTSEVVVTRHRAVSGEAALDTRRGRLLGAEDVDIVDLVVGITVVGAVAVYVGGVAGVSCIADAPAAYQSLPAS